MQINPVVREFLRVIRTQAIQHSSTDIGLIYTYGNCSLSLLGLPPKDRVSLMLRHGTNSSFPTKSMKLENFENLVEILLNLEELNIKSIETDATLSNRVKALLRLAEIPVRLTTKKRQL